MTGCDSNLMRGPASVSLDGQELVVALCEPIDASYLSVSARSTAFGAESVLLLEQQGDVSLAAGSTFGTSAGLSSLSTIIKGGSFTLPSGIVVQVLSEDGGDITAAFSIGEEGIPAGHWVYPDGSLHTKPCGDSQ